MRKQILTTILLLFIFGAISANAQNDLNGTYIYQGKQGETSFNLMLKFERKDAVYYSFEYKGGGTIAGTWSLENGVIKVVLTRGDSNWNFRFRRKGSDLEVAEKFPKMAMEELPELQEVNIAAGTVFKKDLSEPNAPTLKTEEISKRVLNFIKSVNDIKDLSPENIERRMQIEVTFNKENRNEYGFGGNIEGAPDWLYNLFAFPSENNQKTDTVRFSFDYQLREPLNPDLSPICTVDFDAFGKELKDAGFSKTFPLYGVHNRLTGWSFARGETLVNVGLNGGWEPYPRQCVKSLAITIASD
jgi:hypothetical protein